MHRFAALFLSCAVTGVASGDTTVSGFRLSNQANPSYGSVVCTLPGGDLVTFDGTFVDRRQPNGALISNLHTFTSGFQFPSFIEADPSGTFVVVGESTNNGLYQIDVSVGGSITLTTVVFNYAASFAPNGDLYVSAATGGFGNDNDLARVSFNPVSTTLVGHVTGPSGPLEFDTNGDLYYATASNTFPPPPGSTSIVLWTAVQLANNVFLTDANSTPVATGFDTVGSMALDPVTRRLFLAEADYTTFPPPNQIRQLRTSPADSPVIVQSIDYMGSLHAFAAGGGAASCDPYQPSDGTNLRYTTSDFASLSDLHTLRPLRPTLSLSGPGTIGVGSVTASVVDGVPNGSFFLFFCPQSATSPVETTFSLPLFLFHTGMTPTQIRRVPFLMPLDANGAGQFTFYNPGDLLGLYAFQCFVGNGLGQFLGSSTTDQF